MSKPSLESVLAALVVLCGCEGPTVRLPVRDAEESESDAGTRDEPGASSDAGDNDDRTDESEDDVPCDAQNPCQDDKESLCGPLGICVECVMDADCGDDKECDAQGECSSADD